MTPQFLREEAARFRGMAETAEREASKLRLLKMAADYEAQAQTADELPKPNLPEPNLDAAIKVEAGGKITRKPSEPT